MRLRKQTDYALRVLMYLVAHPGQLVTIGEIAEGFSISQNHLNKVVRQLNQLGYVRTIRGKGGGMLLNRPAEQILLGEVMRQVGEQGEIAECFIEPQACKITKICRLKNALELANQAFFRQMDEYSLADMVDGPQWWSGAFPLPPDLPAV